jgi:hypothetical protein
MSGPEVFFASLDKQTQLNVASSTLSIHETSGLNKTKNRFLEVVQNCAHFGTEEKTLADEHRQKDR